VLAAEPVAQRLRGRAADIRHVRVAVYASAKEGMGTGAHHWDPQSRETADHSIPYVVAATLLDGTVTPKQFDAAHIADPALRSLLARIEVVEDERYTALYRKHPTEHHACVTVSLEGGEEIVGESGGAKGDLANPKSDAEITEKFRALSEGLLGGPRVKDILARLWALENMPSVADIPPAFRIGGQ
jgi:2-methylcitrate dehydratase